MRKRGSGILLHITSLPSPYGIGDFGPDAYRFLDFLAEAGQSYWQILPLTLTCADYGNSPYNSFSAFAGNFLLISPDRLIQDGYLSEDDLGEIPDFPEKRVDYDEVTKYKINLIRLAYDKNRSDLSNDLKFQNFCDENSGWLDDYCLFISIKNELGGAAWNKWPADLRDRKDVSLKEWTAKLSDYILREKFFQFLFFDQWLALKDYAHSMGIKIFGDIPIYVNYDSADVWANTGIFDLDRDRNAVFVAGVPPDYFSSTGQLWGHPVYNWDVLKQSCYRWWIQRIGHNMKLFHMFRLDHFRGFVGFWRIHSEETTAINGEWVAAPAEDFFTTVLGHFPGINIVAEDLGIITDDVREIITKFGFPGMKILLFAFEGDIQSNPYAPHNHIENCVIYTGTHDNNTTRGWFENELSEENRKRIADYLGRELSNETVHAEFIRIAMSSVANMVIIPMQDILGLGEEDRMNLPARPGGNWEWRVLTEQLSPELRQELSEITIKNGRG